MPPVQKPGEMGGGVLSRSMGRTWGINTENSHSLQSAQVSKLPASWNTRQVSSNRDPLVEPNASWWVGTNYVHSPARTIQKQNCLNGKPEANMKLKGTMHTEFPLSCKRCQKGKPLHSSIQPKRGATVESLQQNLVHSE